MRDDELSKRASESLPLSDYYDEVLLMPDLTKWEAGPRCRAESNGEGDVLLADVSVDVPLHATSLAGIQVCEEVHGSLVCWTAGCWHGFELLLLCILAAWLSFSSPLPRNWLDIPLC